MQGYKEWSNARLTAEAYIRLAQGAVPYLRWVDVFANPQFDQWPRLQEQAFVVWFPTMLDYLRHEPDWRKLNKEVARRGVECGEVFTRLEHLADSFKAVLRLYTREEQLFLRDRRLQSVHGYLSSYSATTQTGKWYDTALGGPARERLTPDEYSSVMAQFYSNESSTRGLLDRFPQSQEGQRLDEFIVRALGRPQLMQLGMEIGVVDPDRIQLGS
jgi:hypothetical protein